MAGFAVDPSKQYPCLPTMPVRGMHFASSAGSRGKTEWGGDTINSEKAQEPSMKLLAAATLVAGVAFAAGMDARAQDYPEETFKTIGTNPGTSNLEDVHKPFWQERLPEVTGGKIKGDVASQAEVGFKGPEFFRMIANGVADFATVTFTYASGDVPAVDMVDVAGLIQDTTEMKAALDAARPRLEVLLRERIGVEPLTFWPTGGQVIWCATPIETLSDMEGKKVRVFNSTISDLIEALGAIPVTMPFSEVVPSMQRNVIDCGVTGANSGNLAKWTDVATHLVPVVTGWSVMAMVANLDRWESLPEDVQKVIKKESEEFAAARGWKIAENATQHGIWCSTGDERCDPKMGGVREFNRTDLELVELTDADRKKIRETVADVVLPRFAERCGEECTSIFNETVGKALDVEAKPAG